MATMALSTTSVLRMVLDGHLGSKSRVTIASQHLDHKQSVPYKFSSELLTDQTAQFLRISYVITES